MVRRGHNVVALVLNGINQLPHVLADVEVQDPSGRQLRLGTDQQWLACAGLTPDWLEWTPRDPSAWQPCTVESGDLGHPPWSCPQELVETSLPSSLVALRLTEEIPPDDGACRPDAPGLPVGRTAAVAIP